MGAPIKPSQLCAAVPTTSADFCQKIKLVLIQLPHYICQLFSYQYNEDGTLTEAFKNDSSPLSPGDLKWSASATPTMGWLLCNGQAASRTTYAALFAVIGTTYGAGDSTTTFNVPDMKDFFMVGVSATKPLGSTGGEAEHVLTLAEMPAHRHTFTGRNLASEGTDNTPLLPIVDDDYGSTQTSVSTDIRGSDQGHNNLPPWKAFYVYIRY